METYLGKELKQAIQSVQVKSATSKEGNPYTYISITLINGFEKRLYVQQAEEFAFRNAFDMLDTQKQIDVNFN